MSVRVCERCGAPITKVDLGEVQVVVDAQTRQGVVQLQDRAEVMPVFVQHARTCRPPAEEPERRAG